MKRCSKCGEWKEKSEFHKQRQGKDGLTSACKKCDSIKGKIYYEKNAKNKNAYYLANKGKIQERKSRYYSDNKKKYAEIQKLYYIRHPSCRKEYDLKHPEWAAKSLLIKYGLSDPPQELIDLKTEQIRLFRAVRDKRMGEQHED